MHYKAQSAIEFLSTYLWALIIIAIVATALYFYLTLPQQSLKDFCTFSYGAYCSEFFVGNNSAGTTASFVITNPQKYLLINPKVAVNMTNIGINSGSCTPDNYIAPGGRMICNVTFPKTPIGSVAEGNITLQVTVCPSGNPADCSPQENQTYIAAFGTHVIVTPKESIPITIFVPGASTTVTTIPTTFSTVTTSTTSTSTSTSTISAVCYPLTLSGSGTQSASPTSSGGCPSGEYSVGTSVSITATPPSGYTFASWTGTGTGSYTGSGNPASVTMDSAVTETANYQSAVLLEQAINFETQSATISTTEPNSVILIAVNGWSSGSPTVTVNGNSATELYSSHTGNTGQAVMFYYVAPSAGSYTISINLGGLSSTYDQNYAVSVGGVTTSGIGVVNLSGDYNPASLSISASQSAFLFETNEYQCSGSGSTTWSTSSGTITSIGAEVIENCIASSAAYEIVQSSGSYTITVSMPNYNSAGGDQILASLPAG